MTFSLSLNKNNIISFFQKETTTGTIGDEKTGDATSVQGEYTYDDVNIIDDKIISLINFVFLQLFK